MLWNLSFYVLLCLEIERTSITSANIKGQWKVCADWFKFLDCFFLWLEKSISWERIIGYSHLNGGQRKKKQDPVSTMQNTGFTNYYSFLVWSGLVWTPNQPTNDDYWIFSPEWGAKEKETTKQLAKLLTWQKHANGCNSFENWKLSCNKHTKLMAPEYVRQGNGHWKQVSIQNTRLAIPEEKFGWFVIPYKNMVWHQKNEVYFVMWKTDQMRNRRWRGNRALWGRSTIHLLLLIGNFIIIVSTKGALVVITV